MARSWCILAVRSSLLVLFIPALTDAQSLAPRFHIDPDRPTTSPTMNASDVTETTVTTVASGPAAEGIRPVQRQRPTTEESRAQGNRLGFTIRSRTQGPPDMRQKGHYISQIVDRRTGRELGIRSGDELLLVDRQSTLGMSHGEIVSTFRRLRNQTILAFRRPATSKRVVYQYTVVRMSYKQRRRPVREATQSSYHWSRDSLQSRMGAEKMLFDVGEANGIVIKSVSHPSMAMKGSPTSILLGHLGTMGETDTLEFYCYIPLPSLPDQPATLSVTLCHPYMETYLQTSPTMQVTSKVGFVNPFMPPHEVLFWFIPRPSPHVFTFAPYLETAQFVSVDGSPSFHLSPSFYDPRAMFDFLPTAGGASICRFYFT